jgi:hypothetical protein
MWLVLATAAVLLGCGSNAASASVTAGEQAEARMFASQVNLRASDVPGFKVIVASLGENEEDPGPLPRSVEECDGGPVVNGAPRGAASELFQTRKLPIQTVVSAVFPMRNPSIASGYLTAANSPQGLRCRQHEEVQKRAGLGGLARGRIDVAALRPPLAGAPVSGVRVWRCLPGSRPCSRRNVRSFTDQLWFAAGRYVVALTYVAGPRNDAQTGAPVALPVEQRIIARLYSRARAHTP